MTTPRNPELYEFLRSRFGEVRIQAEGQPFRYTIVDGESGRFVKRVDSGEEYAVCCPRCGDTRFRLNVNHVLGTYIEGMRMTKQVHCWNENCHGLDHMILSELDLADPSASNRQFRDTDKQDKPVNLWDLANQCAEAIPAVHTVPLSELTAGHPAVAYVVGRGFDPVYLSETYRVSVCEDTRSNMRMANRRLIIPIGYQGVCVGWQARVIDGYTPLTMRKTIKRMNWPYQEPKYWTAPGSKRGFFLYNYDLAAYSDHVVITEGPTDAWRVGQCCVSLWGSQLTTAQARLVANTWGNRGSITLLGDPGAGKEWERNLDTVRRALPNPESAKLLVLADRDPAEMATEELKEAIRGVHF